ncbi:MAG: putative quinol monooxygenase [Hyphomonadaceae bacterium]
MIILAGSVRFPPENVEKARAPMETMVRTTRQEPGCRVYDFAWDLLEPGKLNIFEIYDDAAAVAAHRNSAHMAAWRALGAELGVGGRDMAEYEIAGVKKI